jgi:E1A-binding protein p400
VAIPTSNNETRRKSLELVLDFRTDQHAYEADFPSVVNVSILEPEPVKRAVLPVEQSLLSGLPHRHAEKRFRSVAMLFVVVLATIIVLVL